MSELSGKDIKYLNEVGPKRAIILNNEINIHSFEDMLYYFPYKYIDKSKIYEIKDLKANLPYVQIKGIFVSMEKIGEGKGERLVASFADKSGVIELIWFRGIKFIVKNIKKRTEYIIFGKPSIFNGRLNIIHPEIEDSEKKEDSIVSGMQAVYHTTEKMKKAYINSKLISRLQEHIFKGFKGRFPETLPKWFLDKYRLLNLHDSLFNLHFPQSTDLLQKSEYRLKFEELFYIQLSTLKRKAKTKLAFRGMIFKTVGESFNTFYNNKLPFDLTGAQKRVLKEIRKDCGSGKQMNRLLQGDVGSGKTLVALMSMLLAVDNEYQACIMAPTEILANQHFETISEFLDGMNIKVSLLTGSSKKSERNIIDEELRSGKLNILIGTHALIEDNVVFKNLGLVVIDEQHRFGVVQRSKLWKKNINPPHVLVMTATPIPRTLAMTLYGDLDVSIIDELPPGRKPINTIHVYQKDKQSVYKFMQKELDKGRQIYIVYPLISESEKLDIKDLESGYQELFDYFSPLGYNLSMLHGKMKPKEKDYAMQEFADHKSHILVATTVIEVGVNVPNASVMLIENSERFGLAQLHQLRGRVGRGAEQSFCILSTGYKLSNESKQRVETMVGTNDGFEIAEADLKLRGFGDIDGTLQSGISYNLKIAHLGKDSQILQYVRGIADEILEEDPLLELDKNYLLNEQLKRASKSQVSWRFIS
ncbi:ATP-dependent DNA helicase RecG [Marinilabiliaceae bacterium JC040]|nr:ATP-dependent DNA helicase RecG [Marinilabiliaceae bacterium JC040]